MKLELKHLAGYLPYELKFFSTDNYPITGTIETIEIIKDDFTDKINSTSIAISDLSKSISSRMNVLESYKPILRPLSDLTKEIEVNGEMFVPESILFKLFGGMAQFQILEKGFYSLNYGYYLKIEQIPHNIVQKLFEWHFDIHGLIEKGLAISIHDVEEAGI